MAESRLENHRRLYHVEQALCPVCHIVMPAEEIVHHVDDLHSPGLTSTDDFGSTSTINAAGQEFQRPPSRDNGGSDFECQKLDTKHHNQL